jgi:septal ring factor EnvC (AmiA/AmiB activator)
MDVYGQCRLPVPAAIAAVILTCLCIAIPAFPADDAALQRIRQEIEDVESRIRGLEGERESFLLEVERLDLQLERQRRHLERLEREGDLNRGELERIRDEETVLEEKLARDREELSQRMGSLYRMGRMNYLRLFLSADSAEVMRERLRYLSYLANRDSRLIESCISILELLEQRRAELRQREIRLDQITEEEQRRQSATLRLRRDKSGLLRQLEQRIGAHQQIAAELEQAAAALEKLLGSLDGGQAPPADRASLLPGLDNHRGLLPWPAAGKLTERFGRKRHPRFGTTTISNGILLGLPSGSTAAAVYFGTVVYDDWLHGYGNLVIVSHGGESYSLYAHLTSSSVALGEWLNKGDQLGYTGSSGSLTGPGLYFELRIRGEPVDPLTWLERR